MPHSCSSLTRVYIAQTYRRQASRQYIVVEIAVGSGKCRPEVCMVARLIKQPAVNQCVCEVPLKGLVFQHGFLTNASGHGSTKACSRSLLPKRREWLIWLGMCTTVYR